MALFLLGFMSQAFGDGVIIGFVFSKADNRPLFGANIILKGTRLGAATARSGRFVIQNVPAGEYTLEVTFIGHTPSVKENVIVIDRGTTELVFKLVEAPIELKAISVTPSHFSVRRSTSISRRTLTREEIKSITPLGEDIYRAMMRLPGVTGNDFSSKFAIRGGRPEETLVLFDGLQLYEPFHMKDLAGGLLSIIDMEVIGSIDLLTGGFTAEYGDKMSGVFNIHSTAGSEKKRRTALGISLMNARIFSEQSFAGDKGSWTVSARRGYYDLLMKLVGEDDEFSPEFYDLFGKISYQFHKNHSISTQFLMANDKLTFKDYFGNHADTEYGNSYLWMILKSSFAQRLFVETNLSWGRVNHDRKATIPEDQESTDYVDKKSFSFYGLKQDWNLEISNSLVLKWGFDGKKLKADYDYSSATWTTDTTLIDIQPSGHELGFYLSERMRLLSFFIGEVGVRYDYQSYTGNGTWSPRANLAISIGRNTHLKAGWGRFYQSQDIHELEALDGVTNFAPAELAEHRVVGLEHSFRNGIHIRVEAYQKKLTNIRPRYINLIGTLDIFPEISGDRTLEVAKSGEAKGVEFYLKQDTGGKFSWWVSYCFTDAKDLITGRTVPRLCDQRHTVDLNINYKPTPDWRISVTWMYHTGWPYTGMFLDRREVESPGGLGGPSIVWVLTSNKLREDRLSDYHRMDLRASRYFNLSKGRLAVIFELINAYSHDNVRIYDYAIQEPEGEDPYLEKLEYHWLPIMPSVGVTWEF